MLRSAKAEMGNVKEENERLKQRISKIANDYHSLHTHFLQIVDHRRGGGVANKKPISKPDPAAEEEESDELVFSLSLGRSADKKEGILGKRDSSKDGVGVVVEEGLSLGSMEYYSANPPEINDDTKIRSSSTEDGKDEEEEVVAAEAWPPSKVLKTMRTGSSDDKQEEEELQLQPQLKKARVSIRARVDTPTMSDGCQWRKYGQKIAKGNPCPRAYYRCTVSPTCPVRKQVQRCVDDMTILITTYEGTHNHPLPLSATAMASTTSAAASMLQSCSSSSNPNSSISNPSTATRPLHQFYFPNSSISTCNSHPTITLDLTTTSALSTTNTNNNNHLFAFNNNRSSPSNLAPRYSSSSTLDFSNSSSVVLPCNTSNMMLGYYSSTFGNLLGKQPPQPTPPPQHSHQEHYQPNGTRVGADDDDHMTIAAATKVIASNPSFRSALAAAITSFVGNGTGARDEVHNQEGEQHQPFTVFQGSNNAGNDNVMMSLFPPTAANAAVVPRVLLSSNNRASIGRPFSAANSEDRVE
ncbi:unnamed protein product [Linum tenue]|uniref:WRKY domain-containing protein n=1 Tax=Linum tenue TaxID=586396 RepID=A0AAV0HPD5_9ROSI|nr:unnamed protein product [Linum tenue]